MEIVTVLLIAAGILCSESGRKTSAQEDEHSLEIDASSL